jgi:hypothetical protein
MKIIIACGAVVLVIMCLVINHQKNMKNKKKKDEIVKFIQNLSLDDFDFILSKKENAIEISKYNISKIVYPDKKIRLKISNIISPCRSFMEIFNDIKELTIDANEKEIKEFYLLLNDADSMKLDICYLRAIVKNQKLKEVIKIINKNYNFVRTPKYFAFYNIDLSPYFESQKFLFTDKNKEALLEEIKSFFLVRVNGIYN